MLMSAALTVGQSKEAKARGKKVWNKPRVLLCKSDTVWKLPEYQSLTTIYLYNDYLLP